MSEGSVKVTESPGRALARKIIAWLIMGFSAWLMSRWVYRHTNEENCRDRGGIWEAAADSCAHPRKARAQAPDSAH
jgi:hypothetical protein